MVFGPLEVARDVNAWRPSGKRKEAPTFGRGGASRPRFMYEPHFWTNPSAGMSTTRLFLGLGLSVTLAVQHSRS